jgi:hypothetical protein
MPQNTRLFDYNAYLVFYALLSVGLLKYGCARKPERFAG